MRWGDTPTSPTRATAARSVLCIPCNTTICVYNFIIHDFMKMSNFFEGSFPYKVLDPVAVQHIQGPGIIPAAGRQSDSDLHILPVYQKLFDILDRSVFGVLPHIIRVCQDVLQLCTVFGEVCRVRGLHMDQICFSQINRSVPGDSEP